MVRSVRITQVEANHYHRLSIYYKSHNDPGKIKRVFARYLAQTKLLHLKDLGTYWRNWNYNYRAIQALLSLWALWYTIQALLSLLALWYTIQTLLSLLALRHTIQTLLSSLALWYTKRLLNSFLLKLYFTILILSYWKFHIYSFFILSCQHNF